MSRSSAIRSTLLKGAREVVPPAAYRLRLPQRSYDTRDVALAPVAGTIRYTLERPHVDALDAFQHNAGTVLSALAEAGVEHFVVQSEWAERPIVGVLADQLDRVLQALALSGRSEPIYVSVEDGGASLTRLVPGRRPAEVGERFTVFTHLTDRRTGVRFDQRQGCVMEVWSDQRDGSLVRNDPQGATRRYVPADSRHRPLPTEVYGHAARTYAPLDCPPVFSVRFPIDVVYMWVDGDDPEWRSRKAQRLASQGVDVVRDASRAARFRQFDELRYSLRSIERFAPWVRRIFLVTDQQRPSWLEEADTRLTVVDHREILPASALPTFNSHAITAALHRIAGLSDKFLVFNDDVFLGQPVNPGRFFLGNGTCRFFLSRTSVAPTAAVPHEAARVKTCDVIEELTGTRPTEVMKHTPGAFDRRLLESLASELADRWEQTVHSPFRSPHDLVPEYIHHYVGYDRRLTVPGGLSYGYFGFGSAPGMADLAAYEQQRPVDVFCVNDLGSAPGQEAAHRAALASFLERQFPHRSSYERAS